MEEGALSAQSLSELYNVSTRKLNPKLTAIEAGSQIEYFAASWPVLQITARMVITAARGVRDHQLWFLDAQLWAAAYLNGLEIILSEDLSDGRIIEGVRVLNPFATGFKMAR